MAEMIEDVDGNDPIGEPQFEEETVAVAPEVAPEVDNEIPEEYRGKSLKDIVKMHQDAKSMIGRQAQEVGDVRRLADELLKAQVSKKPEVEKPEEVDFFENPQEAIRRAVENNPKVMQAEAYAEQYRKAQAQQTLMQKHPDFQAVVQDKEFVDWVMASKVRTKLLQEADNYDVDAADELLSTFKSLRATKPQVPTGETEARKKALQSAAVDASGTGETSRKVFRRTELMMLKMRDPAKYEAMQDQILQAYAEGRVK